MTDQSSQSDAQSNGESKSGMINRILEDVLVRRSRGETVDADSVCDEHPDLMPELAEQLGALDAVEAAERKKEQREAAEKELEAFDDEDFDSGDIDGEQSDWDEFSDSDTAAGANSSAFPRMPGYRITGVLGHGGMGVVYRAVQTKLNRVVALKVLPAIVGIASPSAVQRFRREAASAARLHHTNIVPVHDFGESDDGYYYAMELVQGRPMDEVIRYFREKHIQTPNNEQLENALEATSRSDAYSSEDSSSKVYRSRMDLREQEISVTASMSRPDGYYRQVARWIADAADALHYAHGQRIIHRDVKPSNLLLSTDGRIMVADFGLAKNTDEKTITRTGAMLGTVMYLSPEQAQSDKMRVDHRSDIYSLGATLFELLCHRPVFLGTDEKQVLAAIINQEPVRPKRVVSAIPSELETICLKCLEKNPDARYATAEDLSEDLQRYIGDLPIVAKRPSLLKRGIKFARRHKAFVVASFALILLVAAGFGLAHMVGQRDEADLNAILFEGIRLTREGEANTVSEKFADARQNINDAIAHFEKILAEDPQHIRALGNLAIALKELYNAQSDPDPELLNRADELLGQALDLADRESHAGLLNVRGVIRKKLGRYDDAATLYREVLELQPGNIAAHNNLAINEVLGGRIEEAVTSLTKAAEMTGREDPCDAVTWLTLGIVVSSQDFAASIAHFDQAIYCDPGNLWAQIARARSLMARGDEKSLEEALDDAKSAVRNTRKAGPVFRRIFAQALLSNDRLEEALEESEKALSLGDLPCPNLLVRATALAKLGRKEEALATHQKALTAWPVQLRSKNSLEARAPKGVLWFEGEFWLAKLAEQAATAMELPNERPWE